MWSLENISCLVTEDFARGEGYIVIEQLVTVHCSFLYFGLDLDFIDYFFFQSTNGIVQKFYRFLIDLLPPKNVSERIIVRTNCKANQSQPIGLPKIFIDYLFFQADQSNCTKSLFASSEER